MSIIAGRPYILFLEYMSTFFMRNEIISEDIKNVEMSSFLQFIFYIAIISGVAKGLRQGGKHRQEGPTGHCPGSTIQHSEKSLRNDGESGCGWLN